MTDEGQTPKEVFEEAGWEVHNTGGGCQAWLYDHRDLTYFLATAEDGVSLPEDLNSIILGHYDDQGNSLVIPYLVTIDQVLFIMKAYAQMVKEYRDDKEVHLPSNR